MKIFFKPIFLLLPAAAVLFLAQSCKKHEVVSASPLITTWRMADAELGSQNAYYIFNADGRVVQLENDSFNAHRIKYGYFEDDGKTVMLSMGVPQVMKPVYSNDTCYLFYGNFSNPEIVLVKDNSAPDENNWAPAPVVQQSLQKLSDNRGCLTFASGFLFQSEPYLYFVRSLSLSTGQMSTTSVAQPVTSMDINSTAGCWGTLDNEDTLYRFSTSNLATLFSSAPAPKKLDEVAIGINTVYAYSRYYQLLFTYNILSNTFDAGSALPLYNEFAFSGGYLYATRSRYIDKIDLATKKVVKTWQASDSGQLGGIATDGTSFYVESGYSFQSIGYILKLNLN